MNIKNIINKAYSTAKRKIVGRQKGGVITRMERMTGAKCITGTDASVETANWTWDSAKGVHRILCGTSFNKMCNMDTIISDAKMKKFVGAVIRHETEHGIQTDRSGSVGTKCDSDGIPFRLLNLFEDCRIEYNSAIRKDGDGAFGWRKWQDVQIAYALPTSLLWATKINEAGIKKAPAAYVPQWMGASTIAHRGFRKSTRLVILDFYRRIISASDTLALLPICTEWISIFGKDVADDVITEDSINGQRDPNSSASSGTSGTVEKTGTAAASDEFSPMQKNGGDWGTRRRSMNAEQVARIARTMGGIIQKALTVKNRKSTNGTRFNAPEAMQGGEKAFLSRGRARGRRSVALIVDMSGSMDNQYSLHGMKEVVLAFRKLHKDGKIKLSLMLTQYDRGAKSYLVKESDTDEWINSLYPDGGGEEIMPCLKRFEGIIKASTTSVILTDACLSDDDIDISGYRNAGLNAIGAYIEVDSSSIGRGRARMDTHFARSVIAQEPCELARRLMREILKD